MKTNLRLQLAPGTRIGNRYVIREVVGCGGMGTVYRAQTIDTNQWVAIKSLHSELSRSTTAVERFHQEARLSAAIGHQAICQTIDVGTTPGGAPYLVMPLLDGVSLAHILEENGRLPIERLLDILSQTLLALSAAHQKGIVHRDLKPHNIFVSISDSGKDQVTLLDFGISKLITPKNDTHLTASGTILWTAPYMAPEQAKGDKHIDFRTDIYALGVIGYQALTGRLPFDGDTYNEVMYKILTEPIPFPTSLNPLVPAALERIILKAMSRELTERYTSAETMYIAIESLQTGAEGLKTTGPTLAFSEEPTCESDSMEPHAPLLESFRNNGFQSISGSFFKNRRFSLMMGALIVTAAVGFGWIQTSNKQIPAKMAKPNSIPLNKWVRRSSARLLTKPLFQHKRTLIVTDLKPEMQDSTKGVIQTPVTKKTPRLETPKKLPQKRPRTWRSATREVIKGPDGTEFIFSAKVEAP